MYESPIQRIVGDIVTQMQENEEKQLMATVTQKIGYQVDKNELLKALRYDRGQYDKGYDDGFNDGRKALAAELVDLFKENCDWDEVTE